MKTFTDLRGTTAKFCNVSTNDTQKMELIDSNVNDSIRTMCNLQGGKLRFLEATKDIVTVANQEGYLIPNGFRKLIDLYVYSGTGTASDTMYTPEMVFDPVKWKKIKQARLGTNNVPQFTYVENQTVYMQPIPATSARKITLRGRLQTRDLTIADHTTGAVVSIGTGGTAVVGSGTGWTADMVGRFIQINQTTAANGGDGYWYQIAGYTSATAITLLKPYEGTAISASSATYTIGQCSVIPEAYDIGIVYRATALYWDNQNDLTRAKTYWMKYDGGNEAGYTDVYGGLIGQMLANEGETQEGAYMPPFASTLNTPQAPYYFPFDQASGF